MSDSEILEGDLKDVVLPRVLQLLAAQQRTGILTVQGEDDIVAVSCLNGHIVTADSLNQTQEESLAEILTGQNLIRREDFDQAAREQQSSGDSLLELLVSRGLVTREKLLEVLRFQTYRLMLQVMTWRRGEYKFYGGDEVSYEKGITPISVEELLIRALTDLGERSGVGGEVPKLEAIFRPVPPRGTVKVMGRDGDGEDGEGIWITELQEAFLQRFDGRTSALNVAKSLGTRRYKTLFSLHQLVAKDLIEQVGIAAAAAPPSSARIPAPAAGTAPPAAQAPAAPTPSQVRTSPPAAGRGPAARPAAPAKAATVAARPHTPTVPRPWIGLAMAGLLLALLGLSLATRPGSVLLPFPWLSIQLEGFERQLRQSTFRQLDRAANAHFLMEAKYPETLDVLSALGLVGDRATQGPAGHSLRYVQTDGGYQIDVVEGLEVQEGLGFSSSTTDDLFLDQELVTVEEAQNPLFLID